MLTGLLQSSADEHADERTFLPKSQKDVSYCCAWGRLLDCGRKRASFLGRGGPGRGGEHWPRGRGNREGDGGTVRADRVRAHFAIPYGACGKIGSAAAQAGSAGFSQRGARLLYVWRIGSDGNGHQTSAPVSRGNRSAGTLSRGVAAAELSRKHSRSDECERQRGAARTLLSADSRVGAYCSVF